MAESILTPPHSVDWPRLRNGHVFGPIKPIQPRQNNDLPVFPQGETASLDQNCRYRHDTDPEKVSLDLHNLVQPELAMPSLEEQISRDLLYPPTWPFSCYGFPDADCRKYPFLNQNIISNSDISIEEIMLEFKSLQSLIFSERQHQHQRLMEQINARIVEMATKRNTIAKNPRILMASVEPVLHEQSKASVYFLSGNLSPLRQEDIQKYDAPSFILGNVPEKPPF